MLAIAEKSKPVKKVFIPITDDLMFKETISHPHNRKLLIEFISSALNIKKEIIYKDLKVSYENVLDKTKYNDRVLRGDLVVSFASYIVNLECYSNLNKASVDKSTHYLSRIFSTSLDRGDKFQKYKKKKYIQINIAKDVHTHLDKSFKNIYHIACDNNPECKILKDEFEIIYYRLDKLNNNSYTNLSKEEKILKFIGAQTEEERNNIAKGDDILMETNNWIADYINDENTKKLYGQWAEQIAYNKGENTGYKEGKTDGVKQEKFQIVKNMLAKNLNTSLISEITGLSLKQIKELM